MSARIVFVLTYKGRDIVPARKKRSKKAIAESRAIPPKIFVEITKKDWWRPKLAKAHIRVKAGEYQYLTWREGDRVRTLYLGRKRKT
jgi:hypothetical protein